MSYKYSKPKVYKKQEENEPGVKKHVTIKNKIKTAVIATSFIN